MSINPIYYADDVKQIASIEFTIYRNKDVKNYSYIKEPLGITLSESYENYEPKKGGLVDLRLGTCDIYLPCSTCGENSIDCPGHFGHTNLIEPVFHFGFLNHLKNILQCVCLSCSNLLIKKTDVLTKKLMKKKNEYRFKEVKLLVKNINICHVCGINVPKIKRDIKDNGTIKILIEHAQNTSATIDLDEQNTNIIAKKIKESLSPKECVNILKNITDEDCILLGFDPNIQRPEDLIIEIFPIAPVIIRPSAKVDFMTAATMEDSLTHKISDIIVANKRVKKQFEKDIISNDISTYNQDIFNLLQYHIAIYYDNDSISLPRTEFKTGGRTIKSISERIKGKTGRIRNNLMGKRVDFSARTVITSDPYVDIDQVGVPKRIAMELTIPEEVTPNNIKYLTELVKNGRNIYPGANFVLRINYQNGKQDIQKLDLKYRKKEIELRNGDIVERHIINDDFILFNRQPTLHKPSMMGHKIQVLHNNDCDTFRMNVSVCKPYNADFDGDEMNLHLAQSIQARNEIKCIANVQYQIIGWKDSSPIIGCQQDTLSGAYMLSNRKTKIKGTDVANLLCNTTSEYKFEIDINKSYTGNEVFSYIIQKGINILKKSNDKIICKITDGKIITAVLDKKLLSFSKNSIIHFIWDKFGANKTRRFIDDSQRLILNYLLMNGQTSGFKDVLVDDDTFDKIKHIIESEILKSKHKITQFEKNHEKYILANIEKELTDELSIVQANIGQLLMSKLKEDNFFLIAAESGAKGSLANIAQVTGVIGQQIVSGSRLKKTNDRTLIYFHKHDDTPEARGFIKNSYLSGLKGFEFFINASAGREGLIDTAIRTAQTGYIQRQIIKALEDISVKYDNTNRNANNIIIQLVYGENGINQAIQTELTLNILSMDNNDLKNKMIFTNEQMNKISKTIKTLKMDYLIKFNDKFLIKLKDYRDTLRKIQEAVLLNYKFLEEKYMIPINFFRITQDYSNNCEHIELEPQYIIDEIEKFLSDIDNRLILGSNSTDINLLSNDDRSIKYILEISLYEYLSPRNCIFEYGLTKIQFDKMMKEIKVNFIKAIVDPGEMVGIIAAQSIGEPTSQMTLNTKHSAGSASKSSANVGVNRIQELLHFSKNIKTPRMTIYFNHPYSTNRTLLNKTVSYFMHLSIRYLVSNIEIYYDLGLDDSLSLLLKKDNVSNPFFVNNLITDITTLPFVFRFKLNIEKMLSKEISMLDIKTKFISHWYNNYNNIKTLKKNEKNIITRINRCVILSNNNSELEQYIHIRFNMSSFNYNIITEFLNMVCDDITLKGIENINSIELAEERCITFNKDTGGVDIDKENVGYTSGINFEKIRYIKGINFKRTHCNDINTILRFYGLEAARQMLLYEFYVTFEGSANVNRTHLTLLVDQMCHMGNILSIDRHGLNMIESDPISKASFEKTMDHFVNAAIYNESDKVTTVSSRIAVGKVIKGGTGAFDLVLDTKKIEQSEYIEDTTNRITYLPLEEDSLVKDIIKYNLNTYNFYIPN